ncbi:MAG: GHMP kinase [Armatimonadetes bacterium]|nr:GHMP kinase [Armatimonadota bacterium]NIM23722.1 GHMP kinase [Armatimonadota bacterium]NIM67599.1 GHMP kinase [Armatimonadota bacterium]NIM76122.1 GHMP kinase [Armatimonadota bacterium]NIN05805.1 GHMP kinase [Armatimonadota bacterium]
MIVKAWAPNRILDFGGWTDTWFAEHGCVLNFAVSLYSQAIVKTRARPGVSIIVEEESREVVDIPAEGEALYDGKYDLLKAAVKAMEIDKVDVHVYSDVPAGCGTGAAAAVSVALLGALALLADRHYTPHEVASLAHELETKELGIESGVQDQIAAAAGGIGFHLIDSYPGVSSSPVKLRPEVAWELESRLLLVYTGKRHLSGDVHRKVISDYQAGKSESVQAMETLRGTPRQAAAALYRGDLEAFAEIMNRNNAAQKSLHPAITTPQSEEIEEKARRAGAIGFKMNGAGGGGSLSILCTTERRREVEIALTESGYRLLPFHFDWEGLRVWKAG